MSVNSKIKAEKFEPKTTIEYPSIHPSIAPKSNVKHKQVFIEIIYPPSVSRNQKTFLTKLAVPASNIHQAQTITTFPQDNKNGPTHHWKHLRKNKYREGKKCIVHFAELARGKRHHLHKSMFNLIHNKHPRAPRFCSYEHL